MSRDALAKQAARDAKHNEAYHERLAAAVAGATHGFDATPSGPHSTRGLLKAAAAAAAAP